MAIIWKVLATASTATTLVLSGVAAAQPTTPAPQATDNTVDQVIVTGTRQANQTVADSMSPIRVLSPAALQESGKLGLQEILADVLPSFNLPSQAGGNLSNVIRVAQLRNLNPDQTLILVNGKRRHPGAIVNVSGTIGIGAQATDLNLIPAGAIDHIEVLSDGAAAQYGSDAIAGVINIILKDSDHGGSINIQGGAYEQGDGTNGEFDFNQGFKLGENGFLNVSASIQKQNGTGRAQVATLTPLYAAGDARNSASDGVLQNNYGIPPSEIEQISFNMEKPIAGGVNFYSFGTFSYQTAAQFLGYRAAVNVNTVDSIYPNGFQPNNAVYQGDFGLTIGLKSANILGWSVDLSSTEGVNDNKTNLYNSDSPTYGLNSQKDFYLGELIASQLTNNVDLHRDFQVGLAAPLSVAIGGEYKIDGYQIKAGDVQSYANGGSPVLTGASAGLYTDIPGSQAASGFTPQDASSHHRQSIAFYADLETEILKNWSVGLAGRFEDYSDFGSNLSGKFSTRYQIVPMLAVRGTVSNGFRAPSLGQEWYSSSTTTQYKGTDYKIAILPASSAAAGILGAKPLKAEDSFSVSSGLVFTPISRLVITLDGYLVDISNRIVLSSNIGLLSTGALNPTVASLLAAQGIQGVNVGSYFLNGASTRTQGADLVATYRPDVPLGHLTLNTAFNVGSTSIRSLTAAASGTEFGNTVFSTVSQKQLKDASPANKLILSGTYDISRFTIFVRENRFGHYLAASTVANADSYATPTWTTDFELGYKVTPHLKLSVGAQNVFNTYPSKANPNNFASATYNGANYYNALSPIGISGGDYYGRLNYSW
jgi:iron complex outermembrane receptor protein